MKLRPLINKFSVSLRGPIGAVAISPTLPSTNLGEGKGEGRGLLRRFTPRNDILCVILCVGICFNANAWDLVPRVHFDSNSFSIPIEEKTILNQNAVWLKENPKEVIILEGHCDEWGEAFYNMELGDRRAREVKAYLMEEGVDPERIIMIVSYGSERPLDFRHENEAWKLNRRVEFVLR